MAYARDAPHKAAAANGYRALDCANDPTVGSDCPPGGRPHPRRPGRLVGPGPLRGHRADRRPHRTLGASRTEYLDQLRDVPGAGNRPCSGSNRCLGDPRSFYNRAPDRTWLLQPISRSADKVSEHRSSSNRLACRSAHPAHDRADLIPPAGWQPRRQRFGLSGRQPFYNQVRANYHHRSGRDTKQKASGGARQRIRDAADVAHARNGNSHAAKDQ